MYHRIFCTDDHSRVKLSQNTDKDGRTGDYINANFVDVSSSQSRFCYTQTPFLISLCL